MNSLPKPNYHVCVQDKKVCRQEEIEYCQEIYKEYIVKEGQQKLIRRMFQTLHSDWLNLEQSTLQFNNSMVPVIKSKTNFNEGDILLEIRGSIINKNKLNHLIKQNLPVNNMISQLNCLLWGPNDSQVLVPKGLSRVLLQKSSNNLKFLQNNQINKNCFIEYELGAKYLVSASKSIQLGQMLVLDIESIKRFQYRHESL